MNKLYKRGPCKEGEAALHGDISQKRGNNLNSRTIEIIHGSFIWLTLMAAEIVAVFYLRKMEPTLEYYMVRVGMAAVLCLAISVLGDKPLVRAGIPACVYDLFRVAHQPSKK